MRACDCERGGRGGGVYRLGVLSVHGFAVLQQSLELVVSGEGDDLQDGAIFTKNLSNNRETT